jgi:IMP dehydrogenase
MGLRFTWRDIPNRERALTFDDVLIVPARSDVRSRRDPDLSSRFTKNHRAELPIISANMDTVTEADMAIAMGELGALGIVHRFMTIEDQTLQIERVKESGQKLVGASIGVNTDWKERTEHLVKAGANILTIDIAHGHTTSMIDTIKYLKDTYSDVDVIAGNVATPEGTQELIEAGSDAIKVGIGPGSMCTTRLITGCGVPQLTAIALSTQVADEYDVPVIADGGIKSSGDIVKAFAAGASSVMLGSMLAGVLETPGKIQYGRKVYRGMASKAAQVSWRGEVPEGMAPEGESSYIAVKGPLKDVLLEICGGIRSGMSYINATTVEQIRAKVEFMEMSPMGMSESRAHGLPQPPPS